MLKLINVKKIYPLGDDSVVALKGVNIEFRQNEFVSILGPSGCGKTTLLNIIGGLDRYTSGDIQVDNKTTRDFKDYEWDSYRNSEIGFVFQSYNLIPHLTVLENVTISLTLSGTGVAERTERAREVLEKVGLKDQLKKKPNQLSGGQMQRVAIARALINNPRILLADEPTGALDTKTSVQIMELLKEVSKERLVIMVTHNERLADTYSDRVVRLLDGEIASDSGSVKITESKEAARLVNKRTSMSFMTSLKISFKNLLTKKGRTLITALAGSIGILGIALVLAITNGMGKYVTSMQSETLSGFPITISASPMSFDFSRLEENDDVEYPTDSLIYSNDPSANLSAHTNKIDQAYVDYVNGINKSWVNSISYSYGIALNLVTRAESGSYQRINVGGGGLFSSGNFNEIPDSPEFIATQYDYLAGTFPKYNESTGIYEVALVIDSYNRVNVNLLSQLGINIEESYSFEKLLGHTFKAIINDDYYIENASDPERIVYNTGTNYEAMYNSPNSLTLKITSIMRVKEGIETEFLSSGINYPSDLTEKLLDIASTSKVVLAQKTATYNVLTGADFNASVTLQSVQKTIGASKVPTGISIYPVDFEAKTEIKKYLDNYNVGRVQEDKILYTDLAEAISNVTGTLINTVAIVLSAFAGISLVVSSIMIGIITYISVLERTKEIGILRSIGARKKDIARLFSAETTIIGLLAGVLGIIVALLLSIPINIIVGNLVGVYGIASLAPLSALLLIALSVVLTLIAGIFPSRFAAKKDPVLALRSE